ncbi:hypothetical protein [Burkholderia cepacia]|uniref:hypothetical protein n=1 Tax=Burkholderia cepacia TaxID=292 RepID=UPI002ABE9472|nr:hypothetical protein [Burkholderia cepacia]
MVTLSGRNASFPANGEAYRVIHDIEGLRSVDGDMNGRYVPGKAIDGKNAQFRSLGGDRASFRGMFDGLVNTVRNLSVSNPGVALAGPFASNADRIASLDLAKFTVRATAPAGGSPVSVGTLAGYNMGEISNVKATDVPVSGSGRAIVGGQVGSNLSGKIDRAFLSGRVEGGSDALRVGGLAGENLTVLSPDRGDAIISNGYADVRGSSEWPRDRSYL